MKTAAPSLWYKVLVHTGCKIVPQILPSRRPAPVLKISSNWAPSMKLNDGRWRYLHMRCDSHLANANSWMIQMRDHQGRRNKADMACKLSSVVDEPVEREVRPSFTIIANIFIPRALSYSSSPSQICHARLRCTPLSSAALARCARCDRFD